jgi:hypothetical protein
MRRVLALTAAVLAAAVTGTACSSGEAENDPVEGVPASFFGVVPQAPVTTEDLDRMGEGEVGMMRLVVPWGALDPSPDLEDSDFGAIDPIVLDAARNGIEVLPTLYATPAWVANDLDGYGCEEDCAIFAPRSPAALKAWASFVGEAVDRYGPEGTLWKQNPEVERIPIRDWQIWNEQNSPTFYRPAPDVGAYAELLAVSEKAIHGRDPGAAVILGGMFGTPLDGELPAFTAWDFLRRLYAIPGAEDTFDGVGAHPYAARLEKVDFQLGRIHREIERAGDTDAGIWVTEIGWASSGPEDPLNRGSEGQAEQLTAAFDYLLDKRLDWNIDAVTWYSWRDYSGPGLCSWCGGSGLFTEALEAKPSWEAFVDYTGGS